MASASNQTFGIPQVLNIQTGQRLDLTAIWTDRKCIVCFLRHFNCRFCRQQIADLNRIYQYLTDYHHSKTTHISSNKNNIDPNDKIHVVAIGISASLEEAHEFQKENQFLGELYVDALSSDLAVRGVKSGNSEYETTAPSYHKHFVFDSNGKSLRSEVANWVKSQ